MQNKAYIISTIFLIFLYSCAQIGTITGGEKDTDPPLFVESSPEEKSLNFNQNEIKITFDEFFVLDNLNAVFLSSPPLDEKPDFKIKRKSLILKLKGKLKDSTTYTFLFGDAIKDFHEGNVLKNFKFIFSTGNELDTMEISGKLVDAFTHKPLADFLVMLYTEFSDSLPLNRRPYYLAKTDTAGIFKINYIKNGKYKIFALKDNDANLKFNLPGEKIAFYDSLLTTSVKTEIKTDTFKAGSILHEGSENAPGDTLKKDTLITSEYYEYYPKNILLFAFKEDKTKQYLSGSERPQKEKCIFNFGKPAENVTIKGYDFRLTKKNSFTEKQDSGKTVVIWLKNKNLYSKDSLKFSISYFNKDSADNLIQEYDSTTLAFDFSADTTKQKLKLNEKEPVTDFFAEYFFETENPVAHIDTSKIKLFELVDTLVENPRKQELITHFRPAPDTLVFAIKRPFVNDFFVKQINDTTSRWYEKKYSETDTMLICKITDKKISEKDTLKLILFYDNKFFRGQIQKFKDTLEMPLTKQSLTSVKRPSQDTVILNFKKRILPGISINIENKDIENWYEFKKSKNKKSIILKITDKNLSEEDTLMLKIRTLDYDNTKGEKISYEYVKTAIYKHKRQKILKYKRENKTDFFVTFNKPLISNVKIKDAKTGKENIADIKYNTPKDTVFGRIKDENIYKNDTLKLIISYNEKYKKKNVKHDDTLKLIYTKRPHSKRHERKKTTKRTNSGNENSKSAKTGKYEISLENPVNFKIEKDSVNEKKLFVKFDKKEGEQYVLKLDSLALEDYCGNTSALKKYKIKITKKEDYGKITLKIKGINFFADENFYKKTDTASIDTSGYSVLEKGAVIIKIYDEKENIFKTEKIKKDTVITYDKIMSGTYKAVLIYDKNENGKQDTGNYLKHIQPERIIYFPNDIIAKPEWENIIEIKFYDLNKI